MIKKLNFNEVDFDKYTACIRTSCQYIFQVEKAYLEIVNGQNWDILVIGDYDAVMPVPFVKKIGCKIVLPPMAIQQLGVFSKVDYRNWNNALYDFLLKEYRVYYYPFNADNTLDREISNRKNYILPQRKYEETKKSYSIHRRRNVRPHDKRNKGLMFSETTELSPLHPFIMDNIIGYKAKKVKQKLLYILTRLHEAGFLKLYEIRRNEELLSVALVVSSDREDYFMNFINNKQVESNASSLMVDQILQRTIENRKFSFWGSNVASVAKFYERFGAELTVFPTIPLSKKRLFKI